MKRSELISLIRTKKSLLCVGLDTDPALIPPHLHSLTEPVFEFNKAIIDATIDHSVAYKPNIAFYEAMGLKGWQILEKTVNYIRSLNKPVFLIADAKRGDIGNTSKMYAKAFFEHLDFDAITVAPYMGEDSITPFLEYKDKWVILLGLTSNKGSADFQLLESGEKKLYEQVIEKAQQWGTPENLMFVIGATHPQRFREIRSIAQEHFFLVPGVGAQGGDAEAVCREGKNNDFGLLINSARQIIYASKGEDFAQKAKEKAQETNQLLENFFV